MTPRSSASGSSVSVASSATSDRSTSSRVKERWSARLSRSSASVRSIARALTACRRSTSSPSSRSGSLRATSRSDCVIASGVRSSCEALAANLCCSATCAWSRASRPSMVSARSFSSSRGPASARRSCRLRSEICRVVAVIARSGRRTRPATSQPSAIETDGHDRQRDPRPDEQLVEVFGVRWSARAYCCSAAWRRYWATSGFARASLSARGPAGPVRTPARDDQVGAAGSADEDVGDCQQRRSRQEKQAAVEQGQAQADGPRGQAQHPTWGEPGEQLAGAAALSKVSLLTPEPAECRCGSRRLARWR